MKNRIFTLMATVAFCVASTQSASAVLLEDFDGGGTTPFALTNSGGTAPVVMAGGPSGSFVRWSGGGTGGTSWSIRTGHAWPGTARLKRRPAS